MRNISLDSAVLPSVDDANRTMSLLEAQLGSLQAGALMGMVHAVTGPDLMSALITIAVNQRWAAVWLGVRWGIGHSTGLIIVTGLVVILKEIYGFDQDEMLELFTGGMDWVVGTIMLMLGLWGYRSAWRLRRQALGALPAEISVISASHDGQRRPDLPKHSDGCELQEVANNGCELEEVTDEMEERVDGGEHGTELAQTQSPWRSPCCSCRLSRRGSSSASWTTSLIALAVGILHGIAGPGGVLAVLPTLLMPGVVASCLYLGAFCIFATLTMGCVAGLYGACTYRSRTVSPSLPWILSAVSATTSVFIGIVWLVFSATGTLDEVLASFGIE